MSDLTVKLSFVWRIGAALALAHPTFLPAANPFAENVRSTDPLTPEAQLATFEVPDGFTVQLVTHEPHIHKPLNMAFDAAGRLWVTTSREYPYPAPLDQPGRDRVMIFSNFGPDGRAQTITEFAGGLNIPIGIYPFRSPGAHGRDTWKAVVWSIPHIWLMEDEDGDGRADRREVLYGPFDYTRDTHGNQSSFRRGFDGWLYATHGYNNHSKVSGRDGHKVDMQSGNTYRMRLDGERIEQHTWGQVNPFGMAWDERGNLYSSDCHSSPVYQLLAGGYYPSFGKPHDGLGFAPVLMQHTHGSTAIDGMLYYSDNLWPGEFRDNVFIGNVMTSRINRDRLIFHGSSPTALELDDFVVCEDPWFRPVDNRLGPDGAFYIADFYNRIIGHYEVPLNHPGRDRERGRIWRVVYEKKPLRDPALAEGVEGLIEEMASPSLPRRLLAMNDLADRFGPRAQPQVRAAFIQPANAWQKVHSMWLLHRWQDLKPADLRGAAGHAETLVRTHAMRVLTESLQTAKENSLPEWSSLCGELARQGLGDDNALVRRCAAEVLGEIPAMENFRALVALLDGIVPEDDHLRYVVRKALRDQWHADAVASSILSGDWSQTEVAALAGVALAVPTEPAGIFLLRHRDRLPEERAFRLKSLTHAARYAPPRLLDELAGSMSQDRSVDGPFQLELFQAMEQGLAQRGASASPKVRNWGRQLATRVLAGAGHSDWTFRPHPESGDDRNPWVYQERPQADGGSQPVLSSFPLGESRTGILVSPAFALPRELSFYVCGHDGVPGRPPRGKNYIQLIGENGAVLRKTFAPGNDTAQRVVWDLRDLAGQRGHLEVVDGDGGDAYAWLAFGRLEPAVASMPAHSPARTAETLVAAVGMLNRLGLPEEPLWERQPGEWVTLLRNLALTQGDPQVREAAMQACLPHLPPSEAAESFGTLLRNGQESEMVREAAGVALSSRQPNLVVEAMRIAPSSLNKKWAEALVSSPEGAQALMNAVSQGLLSPRLLQERAVRDRLLAGQDDELKEKVQALTKNLAPPQEALNEQLTKWIHFHQANPGNAQQGREVFVKNCGTCHQYEGEGAVIGPQLDGIGQRGLERLLEDILDPNRNVDVAFRSTVYVLEDGDVVSGLFRREEGELAVLANSAGLEITVPKARIDSRHESETSLMPDNFAEIIPERDFNNLLAFLLESVVAP